MRLFRTVRARLERGEWFDAEVPTPGSNAHLLRPTHRMQVREIVIQDWVDGRPQEVRGEGVRYRADGELGNGGTSSALLPLSQIPEWLRQPLRGIPGMDAS